MASAPAGASLVGCDANGVLYSVSAITGAATNPRASGLDQLVDVEFGVGGLLYGLSAHGASDGGGRFYSINPATGASTLIGDTGMRFLAEGDLAYNAATGTLYGSYNNFNLLEFQLFTIDPSTGAASVVGTLPFGYDPSGMAFDAAGNLWVFDHNDLRKIDPSTGAQISLVELNATLGESVGLAFDPTTGTMYLADGGPHGTDTLYTVDTGTGATVALGPLGVDQGFTGLAVQIPATGSLAFVTASMHTMSRRRRGRR